MTHPIDLRTWRISGAARYPNETSVAYGDGALWWATGEYAFNITAPDGAVFCSRSIHELE